MRIFGIGDLHLSLGVEKPMDIFPGWEGYVDRLYENWNKNIEPDDTVVLAGDISWGMSMSEGIPDFQFIDRLPGKKLVLKGNHDYWWGSVTSMKNALLENEVTTIDFLHNNSFVVGNIGICGSRGWMFESGQAHDEKIIKREALRIEFSLNSIKEEGIEKVLFLHYPPIYGSQEISEYIEIMQAHNVKRCYYGHIHGNGHNLALNGEKYGIEFSMISADFLKFNPIRIL